MHNNSHVNALLIVRSESAKFTFKNSKMSFSATKLFRTGESLKEVLLVAPFSSYLSKMGLICNLKFFGNFPKKFCPILWGM